jgi:hypothetical protein
MLRFSSRTAGRYLHPSSSSRLAASIFIFPRQPTTSALQAPSPTLGASSTCNAAQRQPFSSSRQQNGGKQPPETAAQTGGQDNLDAELTNLALSSSVDPCLDLSAGIIDGLHWVDVSPDNGPDDKAARPGGPPPKPQDTTKTKKKAMAKAEKEELKNKPKDKTATKKKLKAAKTKAAPRTRTKGAFRAKAASKSTEGDEDAHPPAKDNEEIHVHSVDAWKLEFTPIKEDVDLEVPKLAYGLDRCLFKPGVYPVQDPRTGVYNFDPYLSQIMPVQDFDFTALKGFVSSSNDPTLLDISRKENRKYCGSTSSMSGALSHLHFLLSAWRPFNAAHTSRSFVMDSQNYTKITRAPAAIFLRRRNGVYAIDADKEFDSANVLSMLGKSLEKFLTLPREDYEKYHKDNSHQVTDEMKAKDMDAFHFTKMGDFILRSQLDAHDPRLPWTGMFDIKTRAVLSIRMDSRPDGYQRGLGYEIKKRFGQFESFEREYFDMIRSAFLKYSLQVRMGRMDGIFVAYHNTQRVFGFQYIPLEELDFALHGTDNTKLGDQEFRLSLHVLNDLLNRATARFPDQSLRIHVETRPTTPPLMYFFAKPVPEEAIEAAQSRSRDEVEKFERRLTRVALEKASAAQDGVEDVAVDVEVATAEEEPSSPTQAESPLEGLSVSAWIEMNRKVDEAVMNDELGVEYVRDNIEDALEQSGLVQGKSQDEVAAWVNKFLGLLTDAGREQDSSSATAAQVDSLDEDDVEEDDDEDGAEDDDEDGEEDHREGEESDDDEEEPATEATMGMADASAAEVPETEAIGERASNADEMDRLGSVDEMDRLGAVDEMGRLGSVDEMGRLGSVDGDGSVDADTSEQELMPESEPGSSPKLSLKDLILRLTGQVEDKSSPVDAGAEEELEGSQAEKLQTFKRVLAELLADSRESKGDGTKDQDEKSSTMQATQDGSHPAVVGDVDQLLSEMDVERTAPDELFGAIVTVRNKQDGKYVDRVNFQPGLSNRWHLEYSVREMVEARAKKIYTALKTRRQKDMQAEAWRQWDFMFGGALPRLSKAGSKLRAERNVADKAKPVWVYGKDRPLTWDETFGGKQK